MIRYSILSVVVIVLTLGAVTLGAKPRATLEADVRAQIVARADRIMQIQH